MDENGDGILTTHYLHPLSPSPVPTQEYPPRNMVGSVLVICVCVWVGGWGGGEWGGGVKIFSTFFRGWGEGGGRQRIKFAKDDLLIPS